MLSVKITNDLCNMQCTYCYEHLCRTKNTNKKPLRMDSVRRQIENEQQVPYLHGGEPLLAPMEVVEEILSISYQMEGRSSIQTNGTLINDKHIALFKKYNTSVGISIDGPGELGKHRKTLKGNKPTADRVMDTIRKLRAEEIDVGIICVLTKANALLEQRAKFKDWVRELKELGISGRMNPAQIDYPSLKHIELTDDELSEFYCDMAKFILTEIGDGWLPYRDVVDSLLGLNQGTCSFGECDYYNASAEKVIFSDGSTGSCLKTSKTGHIYPRFQNADAHPRGFAKIRYEILPLIEQKFGGCKDCKFWRNCTGGCPTEGLDGDWRNRTRFCKAYYDLFEVTAEILKRMLPNLLLTSDLSEEHFPNPNSVRDMQPGAFYYMTAFQGFNPSSWREDAKVSLEQLPEKQSYCDNGHGLNGDVNVEHGDRPHGDKPHGDSYL